MTTYAEAGLDDFEDNKPAPQADGGYRSPLMARLSGQGQLTLELLRADVPLFQAGRAAEERLKTGDYTEAEYPTLVQARNVGESAKERLVMAAIPLIKHLAQKEHLRRQNWQSKVTFEDLFQEGIAGLMRGLAKYNPEGNHSSPTNYLGQWVVVTMQREVEHIDNDFDVAYDASERFRRIRALRARLANELGRDPSDEEIITASGDGSFAGSNMLGRVKAKNAPRATGKVLTAAQLAEEREMRYRVGSSQRLERTVGDEASSATLADYAKALDPNAPVALDADQIVEDGAKQGLSKVLQGTLDALRLPPQQREVISRKFGLPPHPNEESARDISRALDLHREKVGKVVEAFQSEMARPGGAFHRVCAQLSTDELADIGLHWVTPTLGRYDDVPLDERNRPVPDILVSALGTRSSKTVPPPDIGPAQPTRGSQVHAQFMCAYHAWGFVGVYPDRQRVPKHRACPQCGQPSRLVRLMET